MTATDTRCELVKSIAQITAISLQTGILSEEHFSELKRLLFLRQHNDDDLMALARLDDALLSARVRRESSLSLS